MYRLETNEAKVGFDEVQSSSSSAGTSGRVCSMDPSGKLVYTCSSEALMAILPGKQFRLAAVQER